MGRFFCAPILLLVLLCACSQKGSRVYDSRVDPGSSRYVGRESVDEDRDGLGSYADPDEPRNLPVALPGASLAANVGEAGQLQGTGSDEGSTKNPAGHGQIVRYEWDFEGDGTFDWSSTTTGQATHTYAMGGVYQAVLRVTDDDGNRRSESVEVRVNGRPTVAIQSPSSGAVYAQGQPVSFEGRGVDAEDGALSSSRLEWGSNLDGRLGTGSTLTIARLTAGIHTITLTGTDRGQLTATASIALTISAANGTPTVAIQAPTSNSRYRQGQWVTFQGGGFDPEDGTLSDGALVWTSSLDGQLGTGPTLSTAMLSVGTHTVTLRGTDREGVAGAAAVSLTVVLNRAPEADAGPDRQVVPGGAVELDGSGSADPDGDPLEYHWSPGRLVSDSTAVRPQFQASETGDYIVTLTVTDDLGSRAWDEVAIRVMDTSAASPTGVIIIVTALPE